MLAAHNLPFDAFGKRFNDFATCVLGSDRTILDLIGSFVGAIYFLGAKVNSLKDPVNTKIDSLKNDHTNLNAKIDSLKDANAEAIDKFSAEVLGLKTMVARVFSRETIRATSILFLLATAWTLNSPSGSTPILYPCSMEL